MKPLPLLLSLSALALVGGLLLIGTSSQEEVAIAAAPLPPSLLDGGFDDEESALFASELEDPTPRPPLLSADLEPDPQLISFVEDSLGLSFETPPIFRPVDENEIVVSARAGLNQAISQTSWEEFKNCALHLGFLHEFADLEHVILTLAAAEVRGLITAEENLIRSDFDSGSPPEQAALVNLLARRLLSQGRGSTSGGLSPDQLIAGELTQMLLALAVERQFRKELPDYPPSLNENMRESIMLGVPSFFHELASFAEFQLLERIATVPLSEVSSQLASHQGIGSSQSQRLLSYPKTSEEQSGRESYFLGPIPLQIILQEASTAKQAKALAASLVSDTIAQTAEDFRWSLTFDDAAQAELAQGFVQSYFNFREKELKVSLSLEGAKLIITTRLRD